MLIITYEYLYLTKAGKLHQAYFKTLAKSPSSESVRKQVRDLIKNVTKRGNIFVLGRFGPSEICENKANGHKKPL
jgi:hypothetical protein